MTSDPSGRTLDRREAIRRVSLMLGGASFVGGTSLLTACEQADRPEGIPDAGVGDFTAAEVAYLDEVADTILPETGTPGAKAAGAGSFMALMVTDTYTAENQATFRTGMATLDGACREMHQASFMDADPAQRLALLTVIDQEQMDHEEARAEGDGGGSTHYFRMMKQLSLLGYFTSEIGMTLAQQYVESPGRFDPCVPYTAGARSWAGHA